MTELQRGALYFKMGKSKTKSLPSVEAGVAQLGLIKSGDLDSAGVPGGLPTSLQASDNMLAPDSADSEPTFHDCGFLSSPTLTVLTAVA